MLAMILPWLLCATSHWSPWEAVAHFRWEGERMSVLMEDAAPPCGSERGFAQMTFGVISRTIAPNAMANSSVIVLIGDVLPDNKLHWSVRADPCVVKTVVFTKMVDWHCAVLAPTPMEVLFGNGVGYVKQVVNEVSAAVGQPWDVLSNQIFWRGAHHRPQSCARLLNKGERDPRGFIVKLSKTIPWLNASYEHAPRSVFLQHRYLLEVGGSACTTYVLPPSAFATHGTRRRTLHTSVKHVYLKCTSAPLPP